MIFSIFDSIKIGEETKITYNFTGQWRAIEITDFSHDKQDIVRNDVLIADEKISVFGEQWSGISYKLKSVDENYVLSYEHNITLKQYDLKEKMTDVISIIYDNKMLGELFLTADDHLIIMYKSMVIKAERITALTKFPNDNDEKEKSLRDV